MNRDGEQSVFQQDMNMLHAFATSVPVLWKTRVEAYETLPKGGVGVELGVYEGVNAGNLYRVTQPKHMYLIDAWRSKCILGDPYKYTRFQPRQDLRYKRVCSMFAKESHPNVSVWRCYTMEATTAISPDSLDWIYIDAWHRYEAALLDIRTWTPLLKVGGYMMCHDFTISIFHGGVIEAVKYALRRPGELEIIGKDGEHCATVVLRKAKATGA